MAATRASRSPRGRRASSTCRTGQCKEKIIAGAAFDVWCSEPLNDQEKKLLELDNLVTTPHLGASTVEAQERVAVEIAEHAVMYLKDDIISNAINAPRGKLDADTEPFVVLADRMGSLVQQTVGNHPLNKLEVKYCGALADKPTRLLTVSAVIGYLRNVIGSANTINALPIAKSKGDLQKYRDLKIVVRKSLMVVHFMDL